MTDTPLNEYRPENYEEWARWQGEGDPPARWTAIDPAGNAVIVHRSYADYCYDQS